MNARHTVLALIALAAGFGGRAAAAEPETKPGGPFVVIVGAGEYQDKAITARPTADADAKALYDVVTDPRFLGVPAARTKLFLSAPDAKRGGEVATRDGIVKAVEAAVESTGKDDLLLVAFFGRGASTGDKTVYFTPNTVLKDRAKTAVVLGSDLAPSFKKVKAQNVLLMMDVQYKGFDPGAEKIAEPNLNDVDALLFGSEDKEESVRPQDRVLLLSGFIGSESIARGENSLFGSLTVEALKGKGEAEGYRDGYEPDGLVTSDELVRYLDKELPNEARKLGKTNKEKEGQPVAIGGKTSHFPLTFNPDETAKVKKRVETLAALAKAGTVTEELAKEGNALLKRMPKLKAQQDLRKLYQRLADGDLVGPAFVAARTELKEGLTLAAAEATAFARKVSSAADRVNEVYIKETNTGDLTAAAIRGMYRRIEEPLPTELDEALKGAKTLTEARRIELLQNARARLGKREDLDGNKDADTAILMMMASLNDPYTVYYDNDTVRRMQSSLTGQFSGVGIQIRREPVRDGLLVVTPIKGSPAFRAGIRAGDLITGIVRSVDNEGGPLPEGAQREYSTKGMKTEEAIGIITGKAGTPVQLKIDRDGKPMTFDLKRNSVSVETVMGVKRGADAEWSYTLDAANKIGYVRLTQFTQKTGADLKAAIADLKENGGLNGLILDLRGNPGGYLSTAVAVSELFVGAEKLVSVKARAGGGSAEVYRGRRPADKSFEVVVLINGQSASASEIVAACLQDHERATILGERSYGKGSVQNVMDFRQTLGQIKLTIARYYPPSDRNIDKLATKGEPDEEWGVRPDRGFEVKLTREESSELETHLRELEVIPPPGADPKVTTPEKDRQLAAALAHLQKQIAARPKG
ncbi:S41 family peptidase [Urbifossiella limnaea]|uniref:Carboxy-terminal processing protease CtpA n=1 Tax=Urbifossiella limnaea TaxID=2528023 RepID=A0A517XVN1_9BACT|nr:S41 family peptidase [Urbifossiella limnaea]QDU21568.1 Carboxy-terminal processing protease CtpA precursor [Urbifossiella limnaea]